ncbi:uncharacterized protein LOC143849980 isoform X2 [Tasmannia lanceolata]|uniref:uncharacterized protein LOC143849980 isoform X2 n=1 Tax=Tasmannia lanceolata TaxID=3420 RepID=UPI0040635830
MEDQRRDLWAAMVDVSQHIQRPWISLGDFNAIRYVDERWRGGDPVLADMNDFNTCIDDCSLTDLKSVGQVLSWHNSSRVGNIKLRRLDRALVNVDWLSDFPNSFAHYKNSGLSDHAPIIVNLSPTQGSGSKPFKFHNMWLSNTSLYEVVERSWATRLKGNPIFRLCKKLQGAKLAIRDCNKNFFGRIDIKAPLVRQNLSDVQDRIARDPCNVGLRSEGKAIQTEYIVLSKHEEQLYHQKSRVSWLNLGDFNTSFFHSAMSMRRNQNAISGIEDHNGEICTDP